MREQLQKIRAEWETHKEEHQAIVDEEDIANIVAKQTGIPVTRLTEGETQKVLKMEETLKAKIIGQDEALSTVCRAIRRSRADIKDPNRPIGAFLFLGPTGVGKTLLARLLAIHMFGGEDALIQVDMSEYMEKFAVSRMTGSPPGYVGHEEGGQLTEQVRQRPYCVVLFDEVEKAHPDVMNLLLQILEEGRLTDSFGRKIDFRNTIIIMTSNLGADLIRKSTEVGFGAKESMLDYKAMQEKIEGSVKKHFKPEFINRLDGIVIFRPLDKAALRQVIDLEFKKLKDDWRKNTSSSRSMKCKRVPCRKRVPTGNGSTPLAPRDRAISRRSARGKTAPKPNLEKNFLIVAKDGAIQFVDQMTIEVTPAAPEPAKAKS